MVRTVIRTQTVGVKGTEGSLRALDYLRSNVGRDGLRVQVVL